MILTNGDSWTEGYYLSDVAHAWPNVLSKLTNSTVKNLARGGGSNNRIFRTTIKELCTNSEITTLIIGWTDIARFELPLRHGDYIRIYGREASVEDRSYVDQMSTSEESIYQFYAKHLFNEFLNLQNLLTYIVTLQDLCKGKNIKFLNFLAFTKNYFDNITSNSSEFDLLALQNAFRKDENVPREFGILESKKQIKMLFDKIEFDSWIAMPPDTMLSFTNHLPKHVSGHTDYEGHSAWAQHIYNNFLK